MDINENNHLTFGESPVVKFKQKAKKVINNITIEPLLLVHAVAYGLVCLLVPALYFDKICRVKYFIFKQINKYQNDYNAFISENLIIVRISLIR